VRSSVYQALEAHATDLRQALGARGAGTIQVTPYTGGTRLQGGRQWALADLAVADVLSEIELGTNEVTFGFVPPAADERVLRRIRRDYRGVYRALAEIKKLDSRGVSGYGSEKFIRSAIAADRDLQQSATNLADRTSLEAERLIAANDSAYASSRDLFIAVSAGSVALALVLGLILSWSLIRPIRHTEARLAAIAEGDFTGRLDVPNRDELGALAANVNRMNDELRRLYGDLEAASRHKSEFLANMSHELRTPLNAVIGFSEVLHERMFGELNDRQLEYVEDVLDAGRHLLSLINDVLDLSKVEAGHMELELADVSLSETLKSGLTMHEERATRGGVTLGLNVAPEEILLRADERKLRQIVFNLLSNAIKFTPSGGRVRVSARARGGVVHVAVADTGPGIDEDERESIFEVFHQGRKETSAVRPEGSGLGLPLARRFVELHGGRLWVESTPGQGATFRFTLPVRQED
jgi:signal transduction histidine kinase